jgi:Na+-driven multidrug efflux pump
MDVVSGTVKGMGYALSPMLVSVGCICGIRIFWIFVFFPLERLHSIIGLYLAYPISWTAALIGMIVITVIAFKRLRAFSKSSSVGESKIAAKTK